MIYQQHARYMNLRVIPGTPRSLFQADIMAAITKWKERGEQLIIFIDMNEHILHGALPREFFQLDLQEATHIHWEGSELRTLMYGDGKPIDGVYHTPDAEITLLMQLSFHEGVGDHRKIIINVTTSLVIGKFERRVVAPQAQCLATRNENSLKSYIKFITKECQRHQLQQQLDIITSEIPQGQGPPGHQEEVEWIDVQKSNIQRGGECRCRKIIKPLLPFSPQVQRIDMRQRAYVNMVAGHKKGKPLEGRHILRAAARAGIKNPKKLTSAECTSGAAACQKLLKEQESQAGHLRQEHLSNRYKLASDLKDKAKRTKIKEIIKREKQRDRWRRIARVTGDPQTGATNLVQCMEGNVVVDIVEAGAMNKEIQRVTERRFDLARSAPVTTSSLRQLVGYCASTQFAKYLLQGKVPIPPDMDDTTAKLIEEMQRLWTRLHSSHGQVDITPSIYNYYWGGTSEATSSALSGIHFAHWKAWRLSAELIWLVCFSA